MSFENNKLVGITMGCPVGIGPEIILNLFLSHPELANSAIVLGDIGVLRSCADLLDLDIHITEFSKKQDINHKGNPNKTTISIRVVEISRLNTDTLSWGNPSIETGKAMGKYIEAAVNMINSGIISAMVTCPISKEALNNAGFDFPGHTEMLASLTNSDRYTMMMAGDKLSITLATIHCSLKDITSMLTSEKILSLIKTTHKALSLDLGIRNPRIGVAALNPHAGENGLFGDEEQELITPAIANAQKDGINALGPFPADTVFIKAIKEFDAVVCMYHDQGLIPFKLLHFDDGVNLTLDLPIIRTSVDHGTAYDIAGKGIAEHTSLKSAVDLAIKIAKNRANYSEKILTT